MKSSKLIIKITLFIIILILFCIPVIANNCDNIKLSVLDICYNFDPEEFQLTLKNEGSFSIPNIFLESHGREIGWSKSDIGTNFKNGNIINLNRRYVFFNRPLDTSSFSVVPALTSHQKCPNDIIIEKIVNCKTKEIIWSAAKYNLNDPVGYYSNDLVYYDYNSRVATTNGIFFLQNLVTNYILSPYLDSNKCKDAVRIGKEFACILISDNFLVNDGQAERVNLIINDSDDKLKYNKFILDVNASLVPAVKSTKTKDKIILTIEKLPIKSKEVIIENIKSEKQFLQFKTYYFIAGFILLAIITFITLKIIKSYKKDKKEKKKVIPKQKELKKESKLIIPKDITKAISIKNFTVKYRRSLILDNVDLNIKRGELVCLLGPSGTGKSIIIESVVGRKKPTKGNVKIFDKNITDKKIFDNVGFVPQHAELYMNQTVEANLLSSATKWGIKDARKKVDEILSTLGISSRKNLKASKLSGGQRKLLSLGMELIRDTELLILDEPTTGLDPNTRDNIITILSRIVTKQNKTVFFTTHFMDDAEECDNVIILAKGKIVAEGPPIKLEKRLPGHGKIVNLILDNVTDDLLKNIKKIEGVEKVISEGRNIKIITDEPKAVKFAQKVDEIGGVVTKTEVTNATMKEVFVYYTGKKLKDE